MTSKTKSPRVIALYRVSTEDQSAYARQKEVVRRIVASNNLTVVRTITLIDVAEANVLQNREYIQMLDEVENGEVDGVVVSNIDKLVRAKSQKTAATVVEAFQTSLAKIYTGGTTYDFSTDDGVFVAIVRIIVGENERELLSRRRHHGLVKKTREKHDYHI